MTWLGRSVSHRSRRRNHADNLQLTADDDITCRATTTATGFRIAAASIASVFIRAHAPLWRVIARRSTPSNPSHCQRRHCTIARRL